MLTYIMEYIFPNKNQVIVDKYNLQSANQNALSAPQIQDYNIKNSNNQIINNKEDNIICLRNCLDKIMNQIDLPNKSGKLDSKQQKINLIENPNIISNNNNCLMLGDSKIEEGKNSFSLESNSNLNQNDIDIDFKRKNSNFFNEEGLLNQGIFERSITNSPLIHANNNESFISIGKKHQRDGLDSLSELFKGINNNESKEDVINTAIQIFRNNNFKSDLEEKFINNGNNNNKISNESIIKDNNNEKTKNYY